ncbi:MAG: hypothetical protein F3745_04280 [Nitrospinae bacterium]|nr:hypothetical protein [Nitrospinota bacterium]
MFYQGDVESAVSWFKVSRTQKSSNEIPGTTIGKFFYPCLIITESKEDLNFCMIAQVFDISCEEFLSFQFQQQVHDI